MNQVTVRITLSVVAATISNLASQMFSEQDVGNLKVQMTVICYSKKGTDQIIFKRTFVHIFLF